MRLIQIVVPRDEHAALIDLLEEASPPSRWYTDLNDDQVLTSVLVRTELVEPISDAVDDRFGPCDGFRMLLLPVEASHPPLPEPEQEKQQDEHDADPEQESTWKPRFGRVSREELIEDIQGSSKTTPIFMIMVALATIVACVGMLKDSPAIIIGAMVIAPLLGPNMSLALGTTLGDVSMAQRSIRSNLVGVGIALAFSSIFGLFVENGNLGVELSARTVVDMGDILLALASGAAGAIAFTSGASGAIVGVMVAVALLPPTAACGMLAGAGEWFKSGEAATLTATNVVCINLSATGVFFIQGVRPSSSAWIEKDKAKRASIRALTMWSFALAVLALLIVFAWSD